jgi:hypothetical protein
MPGTRPLRTLIIAALLVFASLPASAEAGQGSATRTVIPPQLFERQIDAIKRQSQVPVLLPSRLHLFYNGRLYSAGGPNRRGWDLELGAAPNCGGATACFIAAFLAMRAERIGLSGQRVELRGGRTGVYRPISCGASCAPANIAWLRRGVRYTIQVKGGPTSRRAMVRLANSALAAGPR